MHVGTRTTEGGPATARVFLADFGLAKSVATGSRFTRTGQTLGTPAYMSPEQACGESAGLTPASDVWGLGCVLHEMLSGRPPFGGATVAEIVAGVLTREPPAIRSVRGDVPRGVEGTLRDTLSKRAGARHPDAEALRDDLDRILRGEPTLWRGARGGLGGAATWAALLALVLAAAAIGVSATWGPSDRDPPGGPATDPGGAGAAQAAELASRARRIQGADPGEAVALLGRALALAPAAPGAPGLRLSRGTLLWSVGKGALARAEWSAIPVEAAERDLAELYLGLEAVFRESGGALATGEGRPILEALAGRGGPHARLARAAGLAVSRDWVGAREALRGFPGWEARLLWAYVESYDPSAEPGAEIAAYTAALATGIPFAWVYTNRGTARHLAGDYAGAVEDQTAALTLSPRLAMAWSNRALARHALGDLAGALADHEEALRLAPDDPDALAARGKSRYGVRDFRGALADFDRALSLQPRSAKSLNNRGLARFQLRDLDGAAADFDAAVREDPAYVAARADRAALRHMRGDGAGALEDCEAALRLDPGCREALGTRAMLREAAGDDAGVRADLDLVLAGGCEDPETWNRRAGARLALGDARGALGDAREALRLAPDLPEAHANAGLARRALGDPSGAAEEFREFLRLAPEDRRAGRVRALLAACERDLQAQEGR
ncbi:MAG: tetratricopeptide repeat protein [Planctomycetales bacterium]|nr:tetratricopeptide repeat protein [Planctomycetales bacterium]